MTRPPWLRMPSDRALLLATVVFTLFAVLGAVLILVPVRQTVKTTTQEAENVTEHRVRNELTHEAICAREDAILDRQDALADWINSTFPSSVPRLVLPPDPEPCPRPLTALQLRDLTQHPDQ